MSSNEFHHQKKCEFVIWRFVTKWICAPLPTVNVFLNRIRCCIRICLFMIQPGTFSSILVCLICELCTILCCLLCISFLPLCLNYGTGICGTRWFVQWSRLELIAVVYIFGTKAGSHLHEDVNLLILEHAGFRKKSYQLLKNSDCTPDFPNSRKEIPH